MASSCTTSSSSGYSSETRAKRQLVSSTAQSKEFSIYDKKISFVKVKGIPRRTPGSFIPERFETNEQAPEAVPEKKEEAVAVERPETSSPKRKRREAEVDAGLTTDQSSQEAKTHFHMEEFIRYSAPNRAFSYTAADGTKTTVAPLQFGCKSASKVKDHIVLKFQRPPCVTILSVVRDAAARLPGGMGTKKDICALVRDSQYIEESVSDDKIRRVTGRALDHLKSQFDPCVQYQADKKLWVYLHKDREEV